MKKLTAIILALVMILSLNLTSLADPLTSSVSSETGTGITTVNVLVDSSNISVTVPLSFTVVAKVDGGDADVPSGYKITNNSAIPVKVDTIAVAFAESANWAFKGTPISAGTAPNTIGTNDIYLSINGQVMAVQPATAPTTPASWNIAASSDRALSIACSTSKLNTTTTAENLITITYVISAGSH